MVKQGRILLLNRCVGTELIKAAEKRAEETAPLMDFSVTEEYEDDYSRRAKDVVNYFKNQLVSKIIQTLFGIFCIIMTTHIGPVGSVLFIAAVFYFIPDGVIKGIFAAYRLAHSKDYICAKNYHLDKNYIGTVMEAMRKKGIY